jgi:hypothetical protein
MDHCWRCHQRLIEREARARQQQPRQAEVDTRANVQGAAHGSEAEMRRRRPAPASTASTLSSLQGLRPCTTVQEDQFGRLLVEVCNLLQPEILVKAAATMLEPAAVAAPPGHAAVHIQPLQWKWAEMPQFMGSRCGLTQRVSGATRATFIFSYSIQEQEWRGIKGIKSLTSLWRIKSSSTPSYLE